jgi:putative oxidoreductase
VLNDAAALIARLLMACVFVPNGFWKLSDIGGITGYFAGLGFPAPTLVAWGTGIFELVAGICLVVGFQTRIVAVLLAAFCIVAGFTGNLGHGGGDPLLAFLYKQAFLKDIGLAGGFVAVALYGAGKFSLDAARRG